MGVAGLCSPGSTGQSTGLPSPTIQHLQDCMGCRGCWVESAKGRACGVAGEARQLCKETRESLVLGGGWLLLSLFLSRSLFRMRRLVALLLGDKETQLSPATALDRTLASAVPTSASGVTVTPKEDPGTATSRSPPAPRPSTCCPSPGLLSQAHSAGALPLGPLGPSPPPSHLLFNLTNVTE